MARLELDIFYGCHQTRCDTSHGGAGVDNNDSDSKPPVEPVTPPAGNQHYKTGLHHLIAVHKGAASPNGPESWEKQFGGRSRTWTSCLASSLSTSNLGLSTVGSSGKRRIPTAP